MTNKKHLTKKEQQSKEICNAAECDMEQSGAKDTEMEAEV